MQLKSEEPHNRQGTIFDATVRSQLDRILGSELFRRSERLSAFLRYVTEEALSGRGDVLKEQALGSELYGKGAEFDGSADPIVRVDARRLRDKLREYYSEFPREPIIITLPKGTYQPAFAENLAAQAPSALKPVSPVESQKQNPQVAVADGGYICRVGSCSGDHGMGNDPQDQPRAHSHPKADAISWPKGSSGIIAGRELRGLCLERSRQHWVNRHLGRGLKRRSASQAERNAAVPRDRSRMVSRWN